MDDKDLIIHDGVKVTDKRRKYIFINLNISCIATSMLATALTTALPPIMNEFKIDVNTVQWITSGFALFIAIITPLTAYLITSIRTKRLYCSALTFFIVGLIICALSPNFWVMMVGRIVQACGSGLISSTAQVIILTIFPPDMRGTAMGWYGLSMGVSPIIAPTLAGILVDYVGWRAVFFVSIVIMVISLIIAVFVFEDVLPLMRKKFDIISLSIVAVAFGGITISIGNMGKYKFVSPHVLLLLIIGIVFTVIFVIRQLRLKVPFLDVRVMKNGKFTISIIGTVIVQLTLLGSAIIFPIYVQKFKGESATISGLVILPGSLAMALISPFAGKLYDKFGMKVLFLFGTIVLTISNLGLYFITIDTNIWIASTIHIFRCIALGAMLMPMVTWGISDIPKIKASDATALLNSFRSIGSAIGSALFVSIMTAVTKFVTGKKKNPEMYGFNFVFLTMTGLSIIIFLLSIFGCKSKAEEDKARKEREEKEKEEKEKEEKDENENENENEITKPIIEEKKSETKKDDSNVIIAVKEN